MRTCNTCGNSLEHKRKDAKFCDDKCKAKRGTPTVAAAVSAPVSSVPLQTDPVFSDLGAALGGAASDPRVESEALATPGVATQNTPDEPPTLLRPGRRGEWADPAGSVAADVADLHERLDRGLARLEDRPTKADVAAMIKAALVPVSREIDRVDRSSASTAATDKLHENIEQIEVQLLGYPEDRFDARNRERPPVAAHAIPNRVVELEKAIWGWPATEPEDSARVETGDPQHLTGKLEVLDERSHGIRNDHDEMELSVTAYLLVLNTVFSRKWGIELAPMVQEELERLKAGARNSLKA
jgi:hypothetical protein